MLLEQQRKTSEETNASRNLSTLALLLIYGKKNGTEILLHKVETEVQTEKTNTWRSRQGGGCD